MNRYGRCWGVIVLAVVWYCAVLETQSAMGQILVPPGVIAFEDAEIFRPTTDSGDYITVYDSDTIVPGRYSLGFYGDYANDPLEIQFTDGGRFSRLVRDLGTMQLVTAFGLFPSFHLGLRLPGYISGLERVSSLGGTNVGGTQANLGDVVANAKLTLLPKSQYAIGLAVLPEFTLPTGNRREFAGTGRFGFGGLLIADASLTQNLRLSLNVGGTARVKQDGQLRGGLGIAYSFTPGLTGILEGYTGADPKKPFNDNSRTPADVIGALRVGLGPVDLTMGGGGGVTRGRGSPDFRAFVGLTTPKGGAALPQPAPTKGPDLSRSQKTYAIINRDEDVRATPTDILEYRITLVNSGDETATNVVVEDPIPVGATYVPGSLMLQGQPLTDAPGDDAGEYVEVPMPKVMFRLSSLDYRSGSNEVSLVFRVEITGTVTDPVATLVNTALVRADKVPETPLTAETPVYPRLKQVVVTANKLVLKSNIHFEFDRATVRGDSQPVLDEIVTVLQTYPDMRLRIEGHTDAVGTQPYNRKLSASRAQAVTRFLTGRGIDPSRLESVGMGESTPVGDNTTPIGRARNRRMEFLIINPESLKLDPNTETTVEAIPFEPDLAMESEPAWLKGKEITTPAMRKRARLDE